MLVLMFEAFRDTWLLCLSLLVFFAVLSLITLFARFPGGGRSLNASRLFWVCLIFWLVFMSIITTLIDSPYLDVSHEVIVWAFMISAFVGLPLSMPPFAVAAWALLAWRRGERVRLSTFGLISLGAFSLGAVTSNMHDVLWCGVITDGYATHYAAGGDLAFFYMIASWFSIPEKIQADYATFGSCALVMVAGELMLAAACLCRLFKVEAAGPFAPASPAPKK